MMRNIGGRAGLYGRQGINISVLAKLSLRCMLGIQVEISHRQSDIQVWGMGQSGDINLRFIIYEYS